MNLQIHIDGEELFLEITRYLVAVDVFRAEHCEPAWRPESTSYETPDDGPRALTERAPSAH